MKGKTISFTIYQRATGKKAMIRGKNKNMYPSVEQLFNAESLMAEMLPHRPAEPITDPVYLIVVARFTVPAAKPKWWKEAALAGYIEYDKKPDFDNILKQVGDCLKKLQFFKDDNQVCDGECIKEYSKENSILITIIPQPIVTRAEWEAIKKEKDNDL